MKLGFKGFDSTLSCRQTKFNIGISYETLYHKNSPLHVPKICSDEGFHYCDALHQVFHHYPNNGRNRFAIIEDLGRFSFDNSKVCTTKFRIIKEITDIVKDDEKVRAEYFKILSDGEQGFIARNKQEIEILKKIEEREEKKKLKEEIKKEIELEILKKDEKTNKTYSEALQINIYKSIQEKLINCHVGGSLGLFLHGVRLNRFSKTGSDLDIVMPYFSLFESCPDLTIDYKDAKASGNDFDQTFLCQTKNSGWIKVDVRIDPKQAYEIIEFQGFKYKVSKLETILAAKMKYALNGQSKHMNDIYEICGKTSNQKLKIDDLPW